MWEDRPGFDHEDSSCKKCGTGFAGWVINHKTGKRFLGCSNWPDCNNTGLPLPGSPDLLLTDEDMWEAMYDTEFYDKDWR